MTYPENIIFTIENNKIYKGNSTSSFDIVYIIQDNKIYKGDSASFSNNIIYTVNKSTNIYMLILPLLLN